MSKIFYSFITCIIISLIISPLIFKILRKLKTGQNILEYVDNHKSKAGTLSMGGLIFIFGCIASLLFMENNFLLSILSLAIMFSYGVLGFLDDILKIKNKHNEGLKPYQKIVGQVGIAVIIAIFIYNFGFLGSEINIPFVDISVDIGWWIIPFIIIFFIAVTNSVNLTDGLDGLAGYVSLIVILCLGVIGVIKYNLLIDNGVNAELVSEYINLAIICFGVAGSILVFLLFNANPASVFMGDTGSLALGGFIASVSAFYQEYLLIVVIGIVFVLTAVSDIIQVVYYKLTKKRVFLMAPYHHHLERKGLSETKIVGLYVFITLIACIGTIVFYIQ